MLILLTSSATPKITTFVREAFAATPLGILLKALRERRAPVARSAAALPSRTFR